MIPIRFYIKIFTQTNIKEDNRLEYVVKFYYSTDLRFEKVYSRFEFGSIAMLNEISNWMENSR